MSDISRPIDSGLEPAQSQPSSLGDLIGNVAAGLPPAKSWRVTRKLQRGEAQMCIALAEIQRGMILAEARLIARAKVHSTEAQIEHLLYGERLDLLARGALKHEEASRVIDLVKDEVAHSMFKEGLKGVSARYINDVIKRAGE